MRLLSWVLCAAAAIIPVISSEEKSVARPKRESSEKKIVCYYTNWSVYRPGTAKFSPQNINPYLCTHLIYAFGGLSKDNALKPFDKYQDIEQGGYAKFNGLKTYNKNLKTMLAIGGWNEGSARFSPLVADAERRKELVKNTVKFLRQNHFDGLDLDWEYPSFRDGGKPRDRDNYATLVQEFREEFERESEKTGRPRLLLTMAVPAGIEYIDKGYDVPRLNKYLDWMNILSYDYHSAFEPAINHHSPLFSLEEDDEYNFDAQLSIDYTVKHYIKLGADRNKLVLGIPTYGRSYTLFNPDATDIGSPADGPGEQGEATREKGYLAYYEICERVSSGGWTEENPYPDAMGPYAYKDNQWVGYDDEGIARAKAKYVNDNDLGGIMFWSIDNDDFRGKCHGKPYPIIEAAKEALLANANELVPTSSKSSKKQDQSSSKSKTRTSRVRTKASTTTEASKGKSAGRTTTTPQPPTTPDPGSDFVCKDEGFFPHPRDCKKYFWCLDSGPSSLGIVAHQFTCPSGLVFNKISDSCDYARNVICKNKKEEAVTTTTTTTTTSTTTARTTTARSRIVITASPPRTTSTTTTEAPEEEEEEEDEEEDEEDPGTIKELISLIKKLGGVEQLEKQLNLQNSDAKEKIKPSLYTKVLQGRTGNRYRGVTNQESTTTQKYTSAFRNRPVGPQSSGTEETGSRNQERPKYVTIQRNRTTKKPAPVEEDSETEEEEIEEQFQPKTRKEETIRPTRRRPQADATTEREYVTLRRSRPPKTGEELTTTSKYKNVVRVRSTTEAVPEEEEDISDEEGDDREEDEVAEEEAHEESKEEVPQKFKKYSAIIRDKKISEPSAVEEEEEETKVSGPHGSRNEGGISSSTTEHTLHDRDDVNSVHKATSSRYVEIRRTTQSPTTENSKNDVNIVNNSPENDEENKLTAEPEGAKIEGFQSRSTTVTESNRRVSRLPFRSSAIVTESVLTSLATLDPINKENEIQRFRGRFRSSTESSSTPDTKSQYSRYKTINRNNSEKPTLVDSSDSVSRFPKRERSTTTTSTTTTVTTNSPQVDLGAQRRFQFAPRTKPTILTPKTVQSTTETFTITVPDLPDPPLTENALDSTLFSSPFPSVTLEPTSFPSIPETADFEEPPNEVGSTNFARTRPSTRFIPTTSTQTSVVTSITESLFTERGRILIPKRDRGNPSFRRVTSTTTTPEPPAEISRPVYRPTGYKTLFRSTTPKQEITKETGRRRRFKSTHSTTTTTEASEKSGSGYVPKKVRNFKKISTEAAPTSSSTASQRIGFTSRNRFKQVEQQDPIEPVNSLSLRFGNTRKRKINSQRDESDLAVEQTENYFGDTYDNGDRYILGGEVRQTSDKNYLNAVYVYSQSTTERGRTRTSGEGQSDEEVAGENSVEVTTLPSFQSNRNLRTRPVTNITPVSNQLQRNTTFRVNSIYRINPFTSSLASTRNRAQNGSTSLREDDVSKQGLREEEITKGSVTGTSETKTTSSINNVALTETSTNFFQSERTTNAGTTNSGVSQFRNFRTKNPDANTINDEQPIALTTFPAIESFNFNSGSKTKPFADENTHETLNKDNLGGNDNHPQLQTTTEGLKRNTILSNFRTLRQRSQQSSFTTEPTKSETSVSENGSSGTSKFRFLKRVRKINARNETTETTTTSSSTFGKTTKETSRGTGSTRTSNLNNLRGRNELRNDGTLTRETLKGRPSSKGTEEEEVGNHFIRSRFRGFKGRKNQVAGTPLPDTNSSSEEADGVSEVETSKKVTQLNDGTVSVIQYKSLRAKESNQVPLKGTTIGFQKPEFKELTTGGLGSPLKGSTVEYLDPSIGTTYGLKSGVFLGVTKGLSSPSVSTERPNTLAGSSRTTTGRTLRPIVVASIDSTPDSSIDTAIRVVNLPLASQSSDGKDLNKATDRLVPTTNRPEAEEPQRNEVLPSTRAQFNSTVKQTTTTKQTDSTTVNSIPTNRGRSNFRSFKTRFSAKEIDTGSEVTTSGDGKAFTKIENDEGKYPRGGKRVFVRTRPIRPEGLETEDNANGRTETRSKPEEAEDKGKDVRTEAPPTTGSRFTSTRRGNQDLFIRNRARSTTSTTTTTAQTPTTERRRTLLDRRRLRPESRSTTPKPDIQSEPYSSTVRSSSVLRRRRPTTSTTTSTTTTEIPYLEVQEDSSLEESKTLDESPDIQDLADPAVVAIHTLATVAPGSLTPSGRPLTYFSPSFGPPVGTPDTYTVHVTPGDIESITPGRIATIAPGTARPTSILTLKPFTIPVITKTAAKQGSISSRKPSPFRANGIPLVTEEPYDSRDDILQQARRLEAIPKSRPLTSVTASPPPRKTVVGKSARPKPFSKVPKQEVVQSVSSPDPSADYEYYDEEDPLANIPASALKVKVHSNGYIECLDQGNFPHPFSCKKFISCAKMENNELLGWEYTCPKHLSFDPVGGICNWAAGLGCQH